MLFLLLSLFLAQPAQAFEVNSCTIDTTLTLSFGTPNRVMVLNGSSDVVSSPVTTTELGYIQNVTSDVQAQLNGKQTPLTFIDSLVNTAGNVSLVGDSATPGDTQYYGTNAEGVLGYYTLSQGVSSVTASSPLSSSGGATPNITCQSASGSQAGCLASADWTTFNGKQSALTFGNLTDSGTDGITVGSGSGAVIGSGTTISQHVADTTHNGYLDSTDWNTFNSKQGSLTPGTISSSTTGVFIGSGANSTVGPNVTVNVQTSNTSQPGLLDAADWNTFNGKQAALTFSSPLVNTAGTVTCNVASGSQAGCLASADWTTFNGKQAAGNYVTGGTGDATFSGPGSATVTLATVATAGTSPKVTFNAKGLVTSGTTLSSGDIPNNAANTSGNAATATALAAVPTGCSANQYADAIAASGNLSCSQVAYSQLSGTPTIFYQTVQSNATGETQRANLNFTTNFSISDSSVNNRTTVDLASSITSNAATATALASSPAQCTSGDYSTGITAAGVANCSQVNYNQLAGVLPNPSVSTLGGIESLTSTSHEWINAISTSGVPSATQPAFTDISGSVAASQLPNPTATSLGGIESLASTSHEWINAISTSGIPSQTQPAFRDISGLVAASQLPNPTATSLGGVESLASTSHEWINAISTSGVPSQTQPAFTDISGTAAVGQGGLGINSTPANGQIPIGNGTNYTAAAITAGSNITVTNASGSITIAETNPVPVPSPSGQFVQATGTGYVLAQALPSGMLMPFAGTTCPTGWLAADGSTENTTTQANLFAAIAYTYGGSGTSFTLPNAKGVFLRGAGSQTISAIGYTGTQGTTQGDQMQGHSHTATVVYMSASGGGSGASTGGGAIFTTPVMGDPTSDGTNGTPRIGTETRPANISVLYCIKT